MVAVSEALLECVGTMWWLSLVCSDAEHRCSGSRQHEMDSIVDSISCSEPPGLRQLRIRLHLRTDDMPNTFPNDYSSIETMPLIFIDRHGEVSLPILCALTP